MNNWGSDRVKLTNCDKVEWGENAIMQVTYFLNDPMFSLFFVTGFKLTNRNLGHTNQFSIFMMQTFPPSQKIMIPKYNAISYS